MDPAEPWPEGLKLKHEKETLGFYITGHPLRKYADEVKTYGNATTGALSEKPSGFDVAIGGHCFGSAPDCAPRRAIPMAIVHAGRLGGHRGGSGFSRYLRQSAEDCSRRMRRLFVKGKLDNDESTIKILATDIYPDGARQGDSQPDA